MKILRRRFGVELVLSAGCLFLFGCSHTSSGPVGERSPKSQPDDAEQQFVTAWQAPKDRPKIDLNYPLTCYDDKPLVLRQLQGYPLAISFIYTRCTNWRKCPRVADTMNDLKARLDKTDLRNKVKVVLISFDPEFDSPIVLRKYASDRHLKLDNDFLLLQPKPQEARHFFESMSVPVSFNEDGVSIHGIQLVLVDKQGGVARRYNTLIWDNEKVVHDIKRLAEERN